MASRVASSRFVGRQAELARLDAIWKSAVNDETAATVLLSGEAGVGKTRLVHEMVERLGEPSLVLTGHCMELVDRALPFGPIVQALRALHRSLDPATLAAVIGPAGEDLAALVPELHPGPAPEPVAPAALFEQVLGVLERLGDRLPTLLVLEDLHWADRSTRDLLVFLARSMHDARVVVVGTYRSDDLHRRHPLRSALTELDRAGAAERIDVARFDRDESRDLIAAIVGSHVDPELVERTYERSDGNAFFVEELLATGAATDDAIPPTLRDIVLARVDTLPDDTRQVLRGAAVIGRDADHRLLAAVAGLDDARLLDAIREAVEQQVLVAETGGLEYRFRHALVHEAVYDDLLPGERVALHVRVAELLSEHPEWMESDRGRVASELACHWYAAHDSARALAAALDAARAAEHVYAYPEALAHVERALELWSQVPDVEARAAMRHVDALRYAAQQAEMAGGIDRALEFMRVAAEEVDAHADPVTAGLVHERWGRYLWMLGGEPNEILQHLDEAVRLVPDDMTPARARVLATQGQQLMLAGRNRDGAEVCEQAIEVAQAIGDQVVEGHARNSLGSALVSMGDPDAGLAQLHRARALAESTRSWVDVARAAVNEGGALQSLARYDEALQISMAGALMTRERGIERYFGGILRLNACETLWIAGRWDEMEEQLREVDALQPIGIDAERVAEMWAQLHSGRGDFDAAREYIERGRIPTAPNEEAARRMGSLLEGQSALWAGDAMRAVECARAALERQRYESRLWCDYFAIPAVLLGAAAAADLGAPDDAAGFAHTFEQWVASDQEQSGAPGAVGTVTAQLATETARADGTDTAEMWSDIAGDWAGHGAQIHVAYAQWRAAEAARRAADRAVASATAQAAYDLAHAIGWAWVRDGVVSLIRRARLDVDLADAPPSAATRLGLTARELDVLALVAQGQTNRQIAQALFISPKTASVHVSNILAKFGVTNRGEAAAEAHRLGLDRIDTPA